MLVRLPEGFVATLAPGTMLTVPAAGSGWLMGFIAIVQYAPPCKEVVN